MKRSRGAHVWKKKMGKTCVEGKRTVGNGWRAIARVDAERAGEGEEGKSGEGEERGTSSVAAVEAKRNAMNDDDDDDRNRDDEDEGTMLDMKNDDDTSERPHTQERQRQRRRRNGAKRRPRGKNAKSNAPESGKNSWLFGGSLVPRMASSVFQSSNPTARYQHVVDACARLEGRLRALDSEELKSEAKRLRSSLMARTSAATRAGSNTSRTRRAMPLAFALCREAARRELGLRAFDVQILGAAALFDGCVAEMATGEGKTLAAVFPAALSALSGTPVHIVTVNEYLAERDAVRMGRVFRALGISVGLNLQRLSAEEKLEAHSSDVTYTTNLELGFDYLRDHSATRAGDIPVIGRLGFAILDEVDSILIDESLNPLLISEQVRDPESQLADAVRRMANVAAELNEGDDYTLTEAIKKVDVRERGALRAEEALGGASLWEDGVCLEHGRTSMPWGYLLNVALEAKHFYRRDIDYILADADADDVDTIPLDTIPLDGNSAAATAGAISGTAHEKNGQMMNKIIALVDASTGRADPKRKYRGIVHMSIEAKEGLALSQLMTNTAEITYQCFYKLFDKLSGMTGTADTEAAEFLSTYELEVISVPPNRPRRRDDSGPYVFKNKADKFAQIADFCANAQWEGRPVLVGMETIEDSEQLCSYLVDAGVVHTLLNAKPEYAAREAEIVARRKSSGRLKMALTAVWCASGLPRAPLCTPGHAGQPNMTQYSVQACEVDSKRAEC